MIKYGLILSDTSRSRAYIQNLFISKNKPSYCLVMETENTKGKPINDDWLIKLPASFEYENESWGFNPHESVETTLNKFSFPYEKVIVKDINDKSVLNKIKNIEIKYLIYSGSGGVILKNPLFCIGKTFIHSHGGFLPEYRGSTCNYYSIINENTIAASVIIMNEKIDDGPIILKKKVKVNFDKKLIDYYYDPLFRAIVITKAINIADLHEKNLIENNFTKESMYYVIHPVLKHIAILR